MKLRYRKRVVMRRMVPAMPWPEGSWFAWVDRDDLAALKREVIGFEGGKVLLRDTIPLRRGEIPGVRFLGYTPATSAGEPIPTLVVGSGLAQAGPGNSPTAAH